MIYLSDEEFRFLERKRLEFLRRVGYFFRRPPEVELVVKKEAVGALQTEISRLGEVIIPPCYEPTSIQATRDSLFWNWRRVAEYYRDFLDMEVHVKTKEVIRIDPGLRKR